MAIALLYFAREKCDIVFLEAGIGGVFDSTNVIEEPLVSVITSVSVDHTALLGNTIEEIAMQKAGIIKNNRPAVVSWNNQDIMNIFSKECILKNSELIVPSSTEFSDIETNIDGGKFVYKGNEYKVKMHGRHQIVNAASAIKALEVLRNQGFEISDEHIKNALGEVQVLSRVEIIKGNPDIIIDGGHNPAGISALLSTLMSMEIKNAVFIFGMVDTKDIESSAKFVSAFAKAVICVDGLFREQLRKQSLQNIFSVKNTLLIQVKRLFSQRWQPENMTPL
jgi:dihydrofolate synthase/folylpolyglutamate synthase